MAAGGKPSRLAAWGSAIFGDPATIDLDHRILNGLMFLVALTGAFTTIQSLAIRAAVFTLASSVVCMTVGAAGYWAARRTTKPYRLKVALSLFFLSVLVFSWFTQAGSHGGIGYFFVLFATYAVAIFGGKSRLAATLLTASTGAALLVLEHTWPSAILPYATARERFAELAFALPFCTFMSAAVIDLLYREYQRERRAKDRMLALVTAEKEHAERTMREKQRLLTIVSHDIANAVTVLQSELSLTRFAPVPHQPAHVLDLDRMAYACANIDEIISSVRMIEAVEQQRIPFLPKPVDLAAVFEYAEVIFGKRLARRHIRLELPPLTAETRRVMAEPRILANQVFGNLLSNAIRFSYPDSVIAVTVTRHDGEIAVAVVDHGIGIPPDLLTGIFALDAKTIRAGTDGEPGTGFGLHTVKHFVELFGGQLTITSRAEDEDPEDHGTTVELRLKSGGPSS